MTKNELVRLRRIAETAVEGISDPDLKVPAFQTILHKLLHDLDIGKMSDQTKKSATSTDASGTTSRITSLVDEGFFTEPRSLPEIQQGLADRGWHYPQQSLGTPLTRLVRKKAFRRIKTQEGSKKLWKYSVY